MNDKCEWAVLADSHGRIVADSGEIIIEGPFDPRLSRIICRDHNNALAAAELLCEILGCETKHDENGHAFLKVPARSMFDLGARIRATLDAMNSPPSPSPER